MQKLIKIDSFYSWNFCWRGQMVTRDQHIFSSIFCWKTLPEYFRGQRK